MAGEDDVELAEARAEALRLMAHHGLAGWTLVFDNAKTRAGVCRETRRQIGLSRVLTQLHGPAEVRETVLHEIAHALVGVAHGHDAVWRATALGIGCSGSRCVPDDAPRPPAPWTGRCPAGHEVTRHRRPTRVQSCARCHRSFDPSCLIEWRYRGRRVPMHPRYVKELRALAATAWWRGGSDPAAVPDRPARRALDTAPHAEALPGLEDAGGPPGAGGHDRPGRQRPGDSRGGEAARSSHAAGLPTAEHLAVGATVRLAVRGKYAGAVGTIEKRGRTRYHVRTSRGLLTVPFAGVVPVA